IFVEERNDLSHHCVDRFGFVTHRLSNRNDSDAVLGKLAQVKFLLEGFAEETTVTVDDDDIECMFVVTGVFDHLLEGGPAIVACRDTSFDVFRNDMMAVRMAPGLQLASLIRNRKIVFSLTSRRYPHVKGCTKRSGRIIEAEIRGRGRAVHGCWHCG